MANPGYPTGLLKTDRLRRVGLGAGEIWTDLPNAEGPKSDAFEGLYGRLYDIVIRTPRLRRAVFGAWGGAEPLLQLESLVKDAIGSAVGKRKRLPVLADVPCGGGVLLPLFARSGLRGSAIEIDIARQMLERAIRVERRLAPPYESVFLRSDALDLPIHDGTVDVSVSLNGLHVVAEHGRFLSELARITRPEGIVWLITPIDNEASLRSRLILAAADQIGVTPRRPPTGPQLDALASRAGLVEERSYGGTSITGRLYRREN